MSEVEDYIYELDGQQREIMLHLHHLLSDLGLTSKIRYRIPFYYNKSWICYLNPKKKEVIELVFIRGNELSNAQDILQDHGRKMVKGITINNVADIPEEAIYEIIQEAILIDETVPYNWKKRK